MPRFLTAAELLQAEEHLPGEGNVALLIAALTDWPTFNLQEPEDLVGELRADVGKPLTYEALAGHYVNCSQDAWKMEAVSSLLQLFPKGPASNPSQDLESLLDKLTANVRARLSYH